MSHVTKEVSMDPDEALFMAAQLLRAARSGEDPAGNMMNVIHILTALASGLTLALQDSFRKAEAAEEAARSSDA